MKTAKISINFYFPPVSVQYQMPVMRTLTAQVNNCTWWHRSGQDTLTLGNLKITKPTIIAWHSQSPLSPLPCDTRVTNTDIDHVVQLLSSDPGWWREKVKWILCWAAAATINHQIRLSKLCPDDESLGQHWNSLSYFIQNRNTPSLSWWNRLS